MFLREVLITLLGLIENVLVFVVAILRRAPIKKLGSSDLVWKSRQTESLFWHGKPYSSEVTAPNDFIIVVFKDFYVDVS